MASLPEVWSTATLGKNWLRDTSSLTNLLANQLVLAGVTLSE